MYTRHSSELQRASKKRPRKSQSPNVDPLQRLLRSKRRRAGQRRTDDDDGGTRHADVESSLDIMDLIDSNHDKMPVADVQESGSVAVSDKGVDDSDEEPGSLNSSFASGPSLSFIAAPVAPECRGAPKGPCPSCLKLYRNAKRLKKPIKDKLLDSDPSSLTCDQWVLLKGRRRGRRPSATGRLSGHLQLVTGRLQRSKRRLDNGKSSCSRPHVFLQRNLRRCLEIPVKKVKKNRRKRARSASAVTHVSKQKRLHGSDSMQPVSTDDSGIASSSCLAESPRLDASSDGQKPESQDMDLKVGTIPSTGTGNWHGSEHGDISRRRGAPKNKRAFRDLLVQLRGNSSQIFQESHY